MNSSPRKSRRTFAGICCASTVVVATALVGSPAASTPVAQSEDGRLLAKPIRAATAVAQLADSAVEQIAQTNGLSQAELVTESSDRMLWVDKGGRLFYSDHFAYGTQDRAGQVSRRPPFALARTFELNSLPNSNRTLYLDFNGHIVTGTAWNQLTGVDPQTYGAYDFNGNPNIFNQAEKTQIQNTWKRIAEDYKPLNVNVTTAEPPPGKIDRANAADQVYGTGLLVTAGGSVYNSPACNGCGGIAYIDVFDDPATHAYYQPAFVFTNGVGSGAKEIAEAGSHEVGHNLSLNHDGTSTVTYYDGHVPWAPLMGVGYVRPVSQWSKGEYSDASNTEDDLTLIATHGTPLRADDHGNTVGTATVAVNNKAKGFVRSATDKDVFRIHSNGASYTISAKTAVTGPNLDIVMRLMRPNGTVLNTVNPPVSVVSAETASGLNAVLTRSLPVGKFFVEVRGTGFGNPANTGYSTYASLGAFTVTAVK